ncbi:MAG: hypothetical protein AB1750_02785 [Chloroflexota bacterium]
MEGTLETMQAVNVAITHAALLISLPFSMAVIVLIYYDLRIRKEGYDLQVLAEEIGGQGDQRAENRE